MFTLLSTFSMIYQGHSEKESSIQLNTAHTLPAVAEVCFNRGGSVFIFDAIKSKGKTSWK